MFLWDHVATAFPPIADTWTALTAIAQATHRLLLGPMVTPLPRRRPWVVARQASTVSRLSGGRLVLGAGLGSDESGDFSRFGEPTGPARRSSMLDEGLDVLKAVWSGEAVERDGPHYAVVLDASARELHRIPIRVAATTDYPKVLRRAAACDGIFLHLGRTPTAEDVADVATSVAAGIRLRRRGHWQCQPCVEDTQPGRRRSRRPVRKRARRGGWSRSSISTPWRSRWT